MSADHKKDYIRITLNNMLNDVLKEYRAPVMTIKKDETVELQLFLYIEVSPKAILFAFDNPAVETGGYISFSVIKTLIIDPSAAIYAPNTLYKIRLTCHKQFDREVQLRAYAIPVIETDKSKIMAHKENGKIITDTEPGLPLVSRELCGMLRILPNDDLHWRENVNGKETSGIPEGSTIEKENLNKYLAQAYVKADIEICEVDLSSDGDYLHCCKEETDNKGNKITVIDHQDQIKHSELKGILDRNIPDDKYRGADYYRIFFLPEKGSSEIGGFNSSECMLCVCYANGKEGVSPVHELLHALGLPHTFNGNDDSGALYTYEDGKTNNIMDYSSYKNSLFEWQWRTINTNLNK